MDQDLWIVRGAGLLVTLTEDVFGVSFTPLPSDADEARRVLDQFRPFENPSFEFAEPSRLDFVVKATNGDPYELVVIVSKLTIVRLKPSIQFVGTKPASDDSAIASVNGWWHLAHLNGRISISP